MNRLHAPTRRPQGTGCEEWADPIRPDPAPRATPELDPAAMLGVVALGFVVFVVTAVLMRRGALSVLSAVFLIGAGMALAPVLGRQRDGAEARPAPLGRSGGEASPPGARPHVPRGSPRLRRGAGVSGGSPRA